MPHYRRRSSFTALMLLPLVGAAPLATSPPVRSAASPTWSAGESTSPPPSPTHAFFASATAGAPSASAAVPLRVAAAAARPTTSSTPPARAPASTRSPITSVSAAQTKSTPPPRAPASTPSPSERSTSASMTATPVPTLNNAAANSCACGYVDDQGRRWREAVQSDFTAPAGALTAVAADWDVQTWFGQGRALGQQRTAANVFDAGGRLALRTSAYDGSGTTRTGQINTKRTDIQYGTFRVRAAAPAVSGVCTAFFQYQDASEEESDIELRSAEPGAAHTVHYTTQPLAPVNVTLPGTDFTTFNEYRFDWLPAATTFFVNGAQTAQIARDVPTLGTQIMLNVWSDGGAWTEGPPTQDAVGEFEYAHLYFNSTTLDEKTFDTQCSAAGYVPACSI